MVTVAAMNVAAGAFVTLTLVALDLPVTGSVVFGLSFTLFGLLLAACTLAAAQVSENTRVVYGIGGVVLGASFVLRAIGDIGDGTISGSRRSAGRKRPGRSRASGGGRSW